MTPTNSKDDVATLPEHDRGRLAVAGDRIRETATAARARANDAYATARERTRTAYGSARERASGGIADNPTGALIGGLAVGALLAVVLPRTQQETKLLGQWGRKLNDGARDAFRKAKDSSITKLDEFGVSTAREKLKELAGSKDKE